MIIERLNQAERRHDPLRITRVTTISPRMTHYNGLFSDAPAEIGDDDTYRLSDGSTHPL